MFLMDEDGELSNMLGGLVSKMLPLLVVVLAKMLGPLLNGLLLVAAFDPYSLPLLAVNKFVDFKFENIPIP